MTRHVLSLIAGVLAFYVGFMLLSAFVDRHNLPCEELRLNTHRTELIERDDGTKTGSRIVYRCRRTK